jgi:flagellar biosynthesis/type III secretory pathway protein FliH
MSSYPTSLLHRLNIIPVDFNRSVKAEPQPWFPAVRVKPEAGQATSSTALPEQQPPPAVFESATKPQWSEKETALLADVESAFERGRAQALQERVEELDGVKHRYAATIGQLQNLAHDLAGQYQKEAVELASRLAKTAIGSNLLPTPATLHALVDRAMAGMKQPKNLVIRVNPDDLSAMNEYVPQIEQSRGELISVRALSDEACERGGCIIEYDDGTIDAQPSVQVDVLCEAIEKRLAELPASNTNEDRAADMNLNGTGLGR